MTRWLKWLQFSFVKTKHSKFRTLLDWLYRSMNSTENIIESELMELTKMFHQHAIDSQGADSRALMAEMDSYIGTHYNDFFLRLDRDILVAFFKTNERILKEINKLSGNAANKFLWQKNILEKWQATIIRWSNPELSKLFEKPFIKKAY